MARNWSFSKLQCYLDCPRKFKYVYKDKLKAEVKSNHLAIGDAFHEFLCVYSLNPSMSRQKLEDLFVAKATNSPMLEDLSVIGDYIPMIGKYMDSGYRLVPMFVDGKPLVEFWYDLKVDDVTIKMKIDIVTESGSVVDYKTSSKKYKQSEADDIYKDKGLQLSLYTLAYYFMFDKLPNKVGFQVIGKGEDMILQNVIRKSAFTEDHVEGVINHMLCNIEIAECDTEFKPSYNKCFFCSFKGRCYSE